MPGVLVEGQSAFPFDSPILSPMFENVAYSHADDVLRASSPLKSIASDLTGFDYSPRHNQITLGISPLQSMDFYCSPPPSPSEKGSPRVPASLDGRDEFGQQKVFSPKGRDEFGQKVFPRSLSKLGAGQSQSLTSVNEELAEGGEGDGDVQNALPFELCCSNSSSSSSNNKNNNNNSSNINNEMKEMGGGVTIPMGGGSYSTNACSNNGGMGSPVFPDAISALQKFLPSNNEEDEEVWPVDSWPAMDVYSCDDFRMYEFKVRRCMRGRSHDWTECPFAHPGEKARRRDPRRFHYSGSACPDFRKGSCRRGDACEYAHGVFECWLHPARYRTQPCKDGRSCRRRVCFFAHTAEQLRLLPSTSSSSSSPSSATSLLNPPSRSRSSSSLGGSYDGSPLRQALAGSLDSSLAFDTFNAVAAAAGSALSPFDAQQQQQQQQQMMMGSSPRPEILMGSSSPRTAHFIAGKLCYHPSSHISSPTSTLIGHSLSPPPLSPPLSPSASPPMSPDSPSNWARHLSSFSPSHQSTPLQSSLSQAQAQAQAQASIASCTRNGGSLVGAPLSPAQASLPSCTRNGGSFVGASLSQVQASMASCIRNGGSLGAGTTTTTLGHSPLSPAIPAHRRHLDRLHSMPTISIPSFDGSDMTQLSCSPVSSEMHPSEAMNDLITTLQQLQLKARAADANRMASSQWALQSPSFLQHVSRSVPGTPTKLRFACQANHWDAGESEVEPPAHRVESGRDLRAKIYGRIGKENPLENDAPDLGWVNELVK